MLKNYFKIGWRNLLRHRAYAAINIAGLSLGIACAILIFTLISFHLSFDNFHPNSNRIYRITTVTRGEAVVYDAGVPQPLGKAFRNDYAFAEQTARVVTWGNNLITLTGTKEIKKFKEDILAFAEPGFFNIFDFPLIQGDKHTALSQPNSAVITENIAKKYYGNDNPVGKTFRLDNTVNFTITGVLKDLPANTDRREEVYLSYDNLHDVSPWLGSDSSWPAIYSGSMCFIRLKPSATPTQVEKAFPQFAKKYLEPEQARAREFRLQPLSDIHFNKDFDGYIDKKYLWALGLIGLFLIVTACVNFVNLATAQALSRSKEVGIRKVLGSLRTQLFWQFIAETTLITCTALLLAYGIAYLTLPFLNQLLRSGMELHLLDSPWLATFLVILTIVVIFFSGSYPGLVLARFQPILALRNKISQASVGGFSLRRILVVTQFAICQMLIIGAIVIGGQMYYSKNIDMGFDKDAIVTLPVPIQDKTKMKTLRDQIASVAGVEKLTLCYQPPASRGNNSNSIRFEGRTTDEPWTIDMKSADDQYLKTFGLQLVAGRNFFPSDTTREYVVNETVASKLGLTPRQLIGHRIAIGGNTSGLPVIGVVKDFHSYSLHSKIAPICIMPEYLDYSGLSIKLNLRNTRPALAAFVKIWNGIYPEYIYSYKFLDERIAEFYQMDKIMLILVEVFAGIAILIGCLGLYGLVSFMALRKTKEIGVRKVLGAGVSSILWIFGKEFARLLLIAFAIAAPVAWWVMQLYLRDFEYKINIGAGVFLLSIFFTFLIATLTVGYRSVRSALANPVTSLRSE